MNLSSRYPRLLRAIRWAAILSETEATCALRTIRQVRAGLLSTDMLKWGGGEAVNHFGGPLEVVRAGIRCRHVTRRVKA